MTVAYFSTSAILQIFICKSKIIFILFPLIILINLFSLLQNVPYADITGKTLVFAIYDFDRFSKHDQIGQVQVAMNSIDLGSVIEEWRDLTSPDNDAEKVLYFLLYLLLVLFIEVEFVQSYLAYIISYSQFVAFNL